MYMLHKTTIATESISKLLKYAEPKVQRFLDDKHILAMVDDQRREYDSHGCFSMVQSITVAHVADENGACYVLDGHHRLKAFSKLAALGYPVEDLAIPVVIYHVITQQEMISYYIRINKNMPVHPIEVSNTYADYEKQFIGYMMQHFPLFMRDTAGSTRCPNIGISELKRNLLCRHIGERLERSDRTIQDLWRLVTDLNDLCAHLQDKQLDATLTKRIEECQAKHAAKDMRGCICFLGIWRKFEWLDICIWCLEKGKNISIEDCMAVLRCKGEKRKRLPAVVRQEVWKKVHANISDNGECFVCGQELSFQNMECGHIHAKALGGPDTLENLMPICKTCNRDMGVMNLLEYKEMLQQFMR